MPAVSSPVLPTKVLGRLAFHKEIGNPGEPFHPCPAKAKLYFVIGIIRTLPFYIFIRILLILGRSCLEDLLGDEDEA
jgi:hypothetical protein